MVNGEVGPLFEEIDTADGKIKILGDGGLHRTLYIGKRRDKKDHYLASNEILYGPHLGIEQHGWAFGQGGMPFIVSKNGERNVLHIGDKEAFKGEGIDRFVRFGDRMLLGGTRHNAALYHYDGYRVEKTIAPKGSSNQDPFMAVLKLSHSYDLWASKVRVSQATQLYTIKLEEDEKDDEKTGDSTLHWIEGDLNLEKETMRVMQHQMPIPRVACKDLQSVEILFGDLSATKLNIPARDEKKFVGTVGIIDKDDGERFVVTPEEGASFNFADEAIAEGKEKGWRADREEWMGKKVEIEWSCAYHKPKEGLELQAPRPFLKDMKVYEEKEEEEEGAQKDDKAADTKENKKGQAAAKDDKP
jgi:hypothetical protein